MREGEGDMSMTRLVRTCADHAIMCTRESVGKDCACASQSVLALKLKQRLQCEYCHVIGLACAFYHAETGTHASVHGLCMYGFSSYECISTKATCSTQML